jgi:regulator of replication initiation timing
MDPIAMITGIKTAIDLATAIKNITDDIELKAKTSELYNSIIGLQNGIMSMQAENHSLLQDNHSLSKKLVDVETWEQEKTKYSLSEICPKVFVYSRRKDEDSHEPPHCICTTCYNQGEKSILQFKEKTHAGTYYKCHKCSSEICDYNDKAETKHHRPKLATSTWMAR